MKTNLRFQELPYPIQKSYLDNRCEKLLPQLVKDIHSNFLKLLFRWTSEFNLDYKVISPQMIVFNIRHSYLTNKEVDSPVPFKNEDKVPYYYVNFKEISPIKDLQNLFETIKFRITEEKDDLGYIILTQACKETENSGSITEHMFYSQIANFFNREVIKFFTEFIANPDFIKKILIGEITPIILNKSYKFKKTGELA